MLLVISMTGGPCNSDLRFSAYNFGSLAVHANLSADNVMQYFNFGPRCYWVRFGLLSEVWPLQHWIWEATITGAIMLSSITSDLLSRRSLHRLARKLEWLTFVCTRNCQNSFFYFVVCQHQEADEVATRSRLPFFRHRIQLHDHVNRSYYFGYMNFCL